MPAPVIRAITRLQDADDFEGTLSDTYYLQWDDGNSQFVLTQVSAGVSDTRANILARTGDPTPTFAYATDTEQFFIWDGSNWYEMALEAVQVSSSPDMGAYVADGLGPSDPSGIDNVNREITDWTFYNIKILGSAVAEEGGLRTSSGTLQFHDGTSWGDALIGIRQREDSDDNYILEHKPEGWTLWLEVLSGNSMNDLDLDGNPLVHQYQANMGAYGPEMVIDGGTF